MPPAGWWRRVWQGRRADLRFPTSFPALPAGRASLSRPDLLQNRDSFIFSGGKGHHFPRLAFLRHTRTGAVPTLPPPSKILTKDIDTPHPLCHCIA